MDMLEASGLFRLLGDDARLRMLRLLAEERLNVSELTAIMGIAQSGVSRHLGLLRDAGLLEENREGGFTYYRAARDGENPKVDSIWPVLGAHFASAASEDVFRDDDARLHEVIRLRRENRETHGAPTRRREPAAGSRPQLDRLVTVVEHALAAPHGR